VNDIEAMAWCKKMQKTREVAQSSGDVGKPSAGHMTLLPVYKDHGNEKLTVFLHLSTTKTSRTPPSF
jgi:hypothetical protein